MARLVEPQSITLVETNAVDEEGLLPYDPTTPYSEGDRVIVGESPDKTLFPRLVYQAAADNTNIDPLTNPSTWVKRYAVNSERMFDHQNNSRTVAPVGTLEVSVAVPGRASWLYLLGLRNISQVTVKQYRKVSESEGGSINRFAHSEDLTKAQLLMRSTIVENVAANPINGTVNADKLVATTENSSHGVAFVSSSPAVNSCASFYVKASGITRFRISLFAAQVNDYAKAEVDLSTGTMTLIPINGIIGGGGSVTALSDGWFRVFIQSPTQYPNTRLFLYMLDSTGSALFSGNNTDGLLLWGWQIEKATTPSTYTPTVDLSYTLLKQETVGQSIGNKPVGAYSWLNDVLVVDRRFKRSAVIALDRRYPETLVTIEATSTAGKPAECGQIVAGDSVTLGNTEWGVEPEIRDFSTFDQNQWGGTEFVPRQNTRSLTGTAWIDSTDYDRIFLLFESLINRLMLFDFNNSDDSKYTFDSLRVFGKLDSFSGGIQYNKTPLNYKIIGTE